MEWVKSEGLEKDGTDEDRNNNLCQCLTFLCAFFHHHVVTRYKLAASIKEIRERLDGITKDKDQFHLIQISSLDGERTLRRSRTITTSHMDEQMIGRDADRDEVISSLVSGSSCGDEGQPLQVIAVVGIGGMGKTTLARKVYKDGEVRGRFNFFYWICVSEDFDVKRLTKAIIEEVKGQASSLNELNSMQNKLVEELEGKHFLLVLDDVWNEDKKKWKISQSCLISEALGSRILVTTRSDQVAKTMNATHIYHLKGLFKDHSWTLFRSIAFEGMEEDSQLESIGREIVSKCKGVPLVITVIGSMMNSKRTLGGWKNVLNSQMWSFKEAENSILPALYSSYYHLPSYLKPCFVYCSVYPKDWEMEKDELIKLWDAQGFVESERNGEAETEGQIIWII